jgi:hypothetical protein
MANTYWADRGGVDSDGDGLSDEFEEKVLGTKPTLRDTDGDGLNDFRERDFGSNPLQPDSDLDGVSDHREVIVGTNPQSKDTDGDTIDDRTEIVRGTATPPDADRDGTPDWLEHNDADRDRLDDLEERWLGSKPNEEDSDFDGVGDYFELANEWSPRSPVDDFRRLRPEIEIDIQEPLPTPRPPLSGGGGGTAMLDSVSEPTYDQPVFEQPGADTTGYDQPSYEASSYDTMADTQVAAADDQVDDFSEFA